MRAVSQKISLMLFFIVCLYPNLVVAQKYTLEYQRFPSDTSTQADDTDVYPFHRLLTLGSIRFYQTLISPAKAASCPMYPSCSRYAYLSFKQYNPFKAFMMTADRLHRDGHDLGNYPYVEAIGGSGYFDPPYPSLAAEIIPPKSQETFRLTGRQEDTEIISKDTENEEERLFRYAEMLRQESDYERAITEYRRLLSYFPNSHYRDSSLKGVFHSYYGLEEYLSAIHLGQDILEQEQFNAEDTAELTFYIGACFFKIGNFRMAREYWAQDSFVSSESEYQEKSILLKGLSYVKESDWQNAQQVFASVHNSSSFVTSAQECLELSQKGEKLRLKNPAVAGILGVVPGLGYLYDGYKQSALASLIVNGLFIWGTVEAFQSDKDGLGAVLGLFSVGFYVGNVYGSVTSAQRKNIKIQDDLLIQFNLGFSF